EEAGPQSPGGTPEHSSGYESDSPAVGVSRARLGQKDQPGRGHRSQPVLAQTVLGQRGQPVLGQRGQSVLDQEGQPVLGQPVQNQRSQPVLGQRVQPVLGQRGQPVLGQLVLCQPVLGQEGQSVLDQEGQPALGQPVQNQRSQPVLGQQGQSVLDQEGQPVLGLQVQPGLGQQDQPVLGQQDQPVLGQEGQPGPGQPVLVGVQGSEGPPPPRRARTAFSPAQVCLLEKTFKGQRYLGIGDRKKLATNLNLSEVQVKTWFQNRRMKLKRQLQDFRHSLLPAATFPPFISHSEGSLQNYPGYPLLHQQPSLPFSSKPVLQLSPPSFQLFDSPPNRSLSPRIVPELPYYRQTFLPQLSVHPLSLNRVDYRQFHPFHSL
uniref:Homeobox domain-containing protein n=1 Tax=Ornithorhynchus anatinus TaxID=9258 RepID=A0A6I8PJ88_ORNAN